MSWKKSWKRVKYSTRAWKTRLDRQLKSWEYKWKVEAASAVKQLQGIQQKVTREPNIMQDYSRGKFFSTKNRRKEGTDVWKRKEASLCTLPQSLVSLETKNRNIRCERISLGMQCFTWISGNWSQQESKGDEGVFTLFQGSAQDISWYHVWCKERRSWQPLHERWCKECAGIIRRWDGLHKSVKHLVSHSKRYAERMRLLSF